MNNQISLSLTKSNKNIKIMLLCFTYARISKYLYMKDNKPRYSFLNYAAGFSATKIESTYNVFLQLWVILKNLASAVTATLYSSVPLTTFNAVVSKTAPFSSKISTVKAPSMSLVTFLKLILISAIDLG